MGKILYHWTEADVRAIHARHVAGESIVALARDLRTSRETLKRRFAQYRLKVNPPWRPRRLTAAQVHALHRRYVAGARAADLGDEVGLTRERIMELFRERDLIRRRPGGVVSVRTRKLNAARERDEDERERKLRERRAKKRHQHVTVAGVCILCAG